MIETTLYRPRRTGERKRKSVRGCICGPDLAVIFLKVLEKGIGEVEGLTDKEQPRRLGPKRANHIRNSGQKIQKDMRNYYNNMFCDKLFFSYFNVRGKLILRSCCVIMTPKATMIV